MGESGAWLQPIAEDPIECLYQCLASWGRGSGGTNGSWSHSFAAGLRLANDGGLILLGVWKTWVDVWPSRIPTAQAREGSMRPVRPADKEMEAQKNVAWINEHPVLPSLGYGHNAASPLTQLRVSLGGRDSAALLSLR